MDGYTKAELEEAQRATASMLHKLSKSKETMEAKGSIKPGSSQQTLMDRRIKALQISLELINRELA